MKKLSLFLALFSSYMFAGCATTNIASQVNKLEFKSPVHKLFIYATFSDLTYQSYTEKQLQSSLAKKGISSKIASDYIFMGKAVDSTVIANAIERSGTDGVLFISPTASGTTSEYVPQSTYTSGKASLIGNVIRNRTIQTTTGGYTRENPWLKMEGNLYSLVDKKATMIWYSSMTTGSSGGADWQTVIWDAMLKVAEKLVEDGVVAK